MKKALENETESTAISGGANSDNIVALTKLLIERRRKLDNIEEKKQTLLVSEINKEIDLVNVEFSNSKQPTIKQFLSREQVINLDDFEDVTEELSEESDNELEDTLLDIDGEFESVVDPSQLKFVFSSYLPCAAHNGQLVLKDGLKLDEPYTKLIKKVSHDIVSKTKCSNLIAEEIRKIEKVLKTYVITRWNSILFMIRSVLKLTPEDFKRLRSKMNQNTVKQKEAKEKFNLSHTERAMLIELEKLLSTFEWMTNEFQGIVLIN